jgi:hypothetical protein
MVGSYEQEDESLGSMKDTQISRLAEGLLVFQK